MIHPLKTIPVLLLTLLGISCNSSKKEKDESTNAKTILTGPFYTMDTSGTSLIWTAYKFTEKLGVSGTFDDYTLRLKTDSGSLDDLLSKAEMTIVTHSVNSANIIRDPKLRTSFFKVFKTDTIFGNINDANKGKGALELRMNNITKDVAFEYSIKNDTLHLLTHLDLMSWNGEEALTSLNKECYELHTGTDGISKLWPDVDVVFRIPLQKE
jgi:hypothetical protein